MVKRYKKYAFAVDEAEDGEFVMYEDHIKEMTTLSLSKDNHIESRYYVWCKERDLPTKIHPNVDAAKEEAMRLAKENPLCKFMVVRALEEIAYNEYPYQITHFCKKSR